MAIKAFETIQDKYGDIPGERGAELRRQKYAPYFLRMGRDVYIAEGCRFYHPDRIVLEDDTRFNVGALIYGSGGVWIGRHARIGPRCFIHSANHEISESSLAFFERGYVDAAVRIGNNVLISANVSILPGAEIGDHAFIGCGAVVTKGAYPSSSTLLGVPAKYTVMTQQVPEAEPELLIYTQTDRFYDLMRHLVSCLGLPQVGIAKDGQRVPSSIRSVLLVGDDGWIPEMPAGLDVWTLSDGVLPFKHSEFPDSRIFKYAYAGRDESVDVNSKIAQGFFWLITRLEKTPGRLSIRELHEWLKMLSLVELDANRHHAMLSKVLALLQQKCPIGLTHILDFNATLKDTQQWACNAEIKVLDRIRNRRWQFCIRIVAGLQFSKSTFSDALRIRSLGPFRGFFAKFKTVAARLAVNTVALRLAAIEQRAKAGSSNIEHIGNIAKNPHNGQELLAAAIYAHVNKLSNESSQLDALLNSPGWALSDVAFVRAKKKDSGFCYSPLTIAWLYLQARAQKPDYQLPEHAGLIVERIEPFCWKVFENELFYDADQKRVSRSLIENWEQLHSADCPVGAQFMLEEASYLAVTRNLEAMWVKVFRTMLHAINTPFLRIKPWPAGYKAAISIRYDVDRPVPPSRITELVRLHAKYANAACASWYYFNEHPDIPGQSRYLLRHWQEIGIHAELASDANAGLGITHHSAPTSDYWRGDRMNQELGNSGASYCEFMASSLQTPRPSLRNDEQVALGDIWLTPLHFPLEGSTRDVSLDYFDKLLPYFRSVLMSGGYAIIGSHPDLNQNILIQLLERENTKDVWFATVRDVVDRCKRVMLYGEVFVVHSGAELALCAKTDIADLAVEYWQPGEVLPREVSLQLKAGKPRQIKISEMNNNK